jgi:hypothetical protein
MARAWIEMPAGSGWGAIRLARGRLRELGYVTEEVRGTGRVWLRLAGSPLERSALWVMPEGG